MNKNLARQQQIEMDGHRSCQRILNWNDSGHSRSLFQTIKNFFGTRARNHTASRHHFLGRFVAERPGFPLNGNLHVSKVTSGAVESKSFSSPRASVPVE